MGTLQSLRYRQTMCRRIPSASSIRLVGWEPDRQVELNRRLPLRFSPVGLHIPPHSVPCPISHLLLPNVYCSLRRLTPRLCVPVLRAIDEDSPTVPTLLTDYILKGRCLLASLVRRLRAAVAASRQATQPPPTPE